MRRQFVSLRKQLGYLYLTTGANGSGKTLFTIYDVRQLQLQTNRPVFFKGFTAKQPLLDFGWVEHDMRDWQSLPDGSICIWDECQDEISSLTADKANDYEKKILSEHRKRGFDFFFMTPHPMNMGAFVRRTIATPGWHRHFKASSISLNSNELKWTATNTQPEKPNSGASGTVTSRTHPKEVYEWYTSTAGDTANRKIPARVWMAILALVAAVALIIGAVMWAKHMYNDWTKPTEVKEATKTPASGPTVTAAPNAPAQDNRRSLTAAEYAVSFTPRIAGLDFTAPRYDNLTDPKTAPRPAACIDGTRRGAKARSCHCWSQQATPLQVPADLCRQIAASGYFDDTRDSHVAATAPVQPAPVQTSAPAAQPTFTAMPVTPFLPPLDAKSSISRDAEVMAFMAKRRQVN